MNHTEREPGILLHLHQIQYSEANFRRARELKVFFWTSSIFLALIGILLIVDSTKTVLWDSFGCSGKIVATATLLFLAIFSITWQNRERRFENEQKRMITKINKLFRVFEEGAYGLGEEETLYPKEDRWTNWGNAELHTMSRYFRSNLVTATWVLAVLAIAMLWLVK
ncbi:MAG TPA: hypothetical protein ENH23_06405 [candidate division Zixibacteria bacterium]|nr:hypothetical protein [candidate division Zixibacteria bacterium]